MPTGCQHVGREEFSMKETECSVFLATKPGVNVADVVNPFFAKNPATQDRWKGYGSGIPDLGFRGEDLEVMVEKRGQGAGFRCPPRSKPVRKLRKRRRPYQLPPLQP